MDYLRGFKIFRDDPEWTNKLLVGVVLALLGFIPVVGLLAAVVLYGWATLLLRQAVRGQELPLPPLAFDVDQWVKLGKIGLKPFLVALIWSIPVSVVVSVVWVCMYGVGMAIAMGAAHGGTNPGPLAGICTGISILVIIPISIVLGLPAAAAGLRTALSDDFSLGLQLSPVLELCKAKWREMLIGMLLIGLVVVVPSALTCGLGYVVLALPAAVAGALLMSQIYAQWVQQGGAPVPVAPHDIDAAAAGTGFGGGPGAPPGGQLPPQGGGPYNQQ